MEKPLITPATIKAALDQRVCGQEYAKTVLAVGVYKHLVRLANPEAGFAKSNILMVGPTGCGKTELIRSLKQFLAQELKEIPVVIADGSSFTENGVRGADVQEILVNLIKQYDLTRAQKAIVYIDEFDKKCNAERDWRGMQLAAQYSLLKMLEGTVVDLQEYEGVEHKTIDTSNILFILGGAFSGIENIIAARVAVDKPIKQEGRNKILELTKNCTVVPENLDYNSLIEKIETIDFLNFGVAQEVLGRLPYIAFLKGLSRKDFVEITHSFFAKEYAELFRKEGIEVDISEEAVQAIAEGAETLHLGARAIKAVLEPLIFDLLFEKVSLSCSKQVVHIDRETVLQYRRTTLSC